MIIIIISILLYMSLIQFLLLHFYFVTLLFDKASIYFAHSLADKIGKQTNIFVQEKQNK